MVTTPACKVTWKNGNTPLKTDTIRKGTAPAYNGSITIKQSDEQYSYTFSVWTDGKTTYGPTDTLHAVAGNATYTATFRACP